VCFAEHVAHDLARRAGLVASRTEHLLHDGEEPVPYLRIKRYDRVLGAVSDLLRRHSKDPARDLAALRDWQIFNFLVGNSDGHAKNLSLLYPLGESVPALAPFYDLVCIEFIVRIRAGTYDRAMAFRVGDHAVPEEIGRDDWVKLGRSMGLPPKPTLRRLEEMALALPHLARETRHAFAASFGDNQVYDRLEETIRDRCRWVCTSVLGGK
jgi:serine/threonine-protein kinase HipA